MEPGVDFWPPVEQQLHGCGLADNQGSGEGDQQYPDDIYATNTYAVNIFYMHITDKKLHLFVSYKGLYRKYLFQFTGEEL